MKTIKGFIILLIVNLIVVSCGDGDISEDDKLNIAVAIVPQETYVKAVAGDLVDVITMIPPGASEANYQPTPKQMAKLSDSSIYFSMGVPAEKENILPKIKDFNKDINIVRLDDRVNDVYPDIFFEEEEHEDEGDHDEDNHDEHSHTGRDPHIWLSPSRVKLIINIIKDELIDIDPSNEEVYSKNAKEYIKKLEDVDKEIKDTLKGLSKKSFIVYHPSFGYFAEEYDLNMVAIEESGKEATGKRLKSIIDMAKEKDIKVIFYQSEFDKGQAVTIAKEIGGEALAIETLSPDYIENLRKISNTFKEVLR